jgi:hypothetical protein
MMKFFALGFAFAAACYLPIHPARSQTANVQELTPQEKQPTAQRRIVRQVAGSTIAGLVWSDKKPSFTFISDKRTDGLVEICLPPNTDTGERIWLEVQTRDGALIADYSYIPSAPFGRKRLVVPLGPLSKQDFSQYPTDDVAISAFLGKSRIDSETWLAVRTGEGDRTLTLQVNAQTQAKLRVGDGPQTECQSIDSKTSSNPKVGNVHFDTLCRFDPHLVVSSFTARLLLVGANGLSATSLPISSCSP